MRISARNQLRGTIVDIVKGATTSHVRIDVGGGIELPRIFRRLFLLRATRPSWAPQGSRSSSLPPRLAGCSDRLE